MMNHRLQMKRLLLALLFFSTPLIIAETNNLDKYANEKLNEKNCDWIIANDVSNKKIGFDSDFNEVSIFYKNKNSEKLKYKPKSEISDEVVEKIINHLN